MLDSKIILTHTDRIGRCVVTGTGYAALLDITIKERYATVHDATCAEVIIDLLNRYASEDSDSHGQPPRSSRATSAPI